MIDNTGNFGIPLSIPSLGEKEAQYVTECLQDGWISSAGPFVTRFEKEFSAYVGVEHAVALSSGTAALHLSLLVCGLTSEHEVFVPTLTFAATANAVAYTGATPIFVDCDSNLQMSPSHLIHIISTHYNWDGKNLCNKITNRLAKALVPTHIIGYACDMDTLLEISQKYQLIIIEDACEGLGVKYKGQHLGQFGKLACFSFNGNKIISSGSGGMIVTQDKQLAQRCRYLSTQAKDNPIEYEHNEIGFNYRLSNVLSALGCAQLEKLDSYIFKKKEIAAIYNTAFQNIEGIETIKTPDWCDNSYWLYTILIDEKKFGRSNRDILYCLLEKKIQTRPLWQPLHLSKAYQHLTSGFSENFHSAENIHKKALSLPCSVGIKNFQVENVIEEILKLKI